MRHAFLLSIALVFLAVAGSGRVWAEGPDKKHAPVKKVTLTADHQEKHYEIDSKDKIEAFVKDFTKRVEEGTFEQLKPHQEVNVMDLKWDLGLWTIVVFVILFLILKAKAWGPILEGLQKREATIRAALEEARAAQEENQRLQVKYRQEMDAKMAEIPKIMEEARRDAEALKEELRSQATREIQQDRQRLRREIETAKDHALEELWQQAAQLATLISAKAIGRSLSEDDHRRLLDESLEELRQAGQEQRA